MVKKLIRTPAAVDITQMEPLIPETKELDSLLELASDLRQKSYKLVTNPLPGLNKRLRVILRAMNSYYTNKIEGQHTLPADIEKALNNQFSNDNDIAKKQRIARAHLITEAWLEDFASEKGWRDTFSAELLCDIHYHLYSNMSPEDRVTDTDEPVNEGQFRKQNVTVGIHMPPEHKYLPEFINRWSSAYIALPDGDMALVGLACSHQRLAWIHPFNDGNGRVARLHTHLTLHRMGLTNGFWSPMRGLARTHQQYYEHLHNADTLRQGNYDGRGALSQSALIDWCKYFLTICIDQVSFMEKMLNLGDFKDRLETLLIVEEKKGFSSLKMEALIPLHYIAITGPIERSEFKKMCGIPERSAERLLKALLDYELLLSDTPRGKVYMGVPLQSLKFLFPNLWPEAEVNNNQ
jgi:Fic family protein